MATYICNTGYQLSSFTTRTCQSDRTWSGDDTTCQGNSLATCTSMHGVLYYPSIAIDCGSLDAPSNGAVHISSGTTFMMIATYICNPGYTLTAGETIRTCQANGFWSAEAPTCDGEYVIAKF